MPGAEDRRDWEIEVIRREMKGNGKAIERQDERLDKVETDVAKLWDRSELAARLEDRIRVLEDFRASTIENVKALTETVKDLKNSDVWLSRMLATSLVGGIITAVGSMILFFIQK